MSGFSLSSLQILLFSYQHLNVTIAFITSLITKRGVCLKKTIVVLLMSVCFLLVAGYFNNDTTKKSVKYSEANQHSTQTISNVNDAQTVIEAFVRL